ncbi:GRAM domain-containing protein 4-like isoform X3 [Nerophis lumbriciformis]|uniref:GRAM domain-containing protein 4-like isoform X3 n=1 Tax=Nerophis lumbriciformis TaxID=546530 RepID=UPI002AE04932|nr:GRAM domain-containing protein 4-like isoform X3 [Nerophis lumbriciformis]
MRRRLDRIRNWSHRRAEDWADPAESPSTSDTECSEEVLSGTPPVLQEDPKTDLNEIKGHLEITLLEKHFLQEELRKLREEESSVDTLREELEKEHCRNVELEQKIKNMSRRLEDPTSAAPIAPPPQALGAAEKDKEDMYSRFQRWLLRYLGVDFQDFNFQPEEEVAEPDEQLSARRLTENMRRLKRGLRPVTNFKRDLSALSSWYSVYTSAIAFTMYMYATWRGWTISMFLFLAVLRLSLNYLIARGWRIQWSIVPEISEPVEPPREDLTVTEKFQLVLHVAQKVQIIFGKMADVLEKIKNLFMWVDPKLTKKLYVAVWVLFIASCLLPYKVLGLIIGVVAGVKFFIINFIFRSCPKLRERYDTVHIVWTSLPTDLQLRERGDPSLSRRVPSGEDVGAGKSFSTKRGAFHEVFNLPESELPLTACEGGWRCCLINRDKKTPTDYIRHGVLYVTENHLCFECSRSSSSKRNKVIKLLDIVDIQKYKVLSVLQGFGMGISIATPSTQKPLVFGAMANRDEAFHLISSQHKKTVAMVTAAIPET